MEISIYDVLTKLEPVIHFNKNDEYCGYMSKSSELLLFTAELITKHKGFADLFTDVNSETADMDNIKFYDINHEQNIMFHNGTIIDFRLFALLYQFNPVVKVHKADSDFPVGFNIADTVYAVIAPKERDTDFPVDTFFKSTTITTLAEKLQAVIDAPLKFIYDITYSEQGIYISSSLVKKYYCCKAFEQHFGTNNMLLLQVDKLDLTPNISVVTNKDFDDTCQCVEFHFPVYYCMFCGKQPIFQIQHTYVKKKHCKEVLETKTVCEYEETIITPEELATLQKNR